MAKVAVIAGAGPAGLTAAYELLKRSDIVPIVFEETDMIGGISQTYVYKGNRIDIGGHRFFSKSDRIMKWWFNILPPQGAPAADTVEKQHEIDYADEVLIDFLCEACAGGAKTVRRRAPDPEQEDAVMLQRPRLSRIFYLRSFFPYPVAITLSVAMRLGIFNTFLILLSYIKAQIFPLRDETYLDAFYTNRFGKRLFETFFKSYTEKVWGVPCNQIRADWGAQRVKGLSLRSALVHAVRDMISSDSKKKQEQRETTLITRFHYPKFGPGQLWETVATQVTQCGGQVHMHSRVVGVRTEGGKVVAVTVEDKKTGERRDVPCDYFFSTMPIKHLLSMLTPEPPSDIAKVAKWLVYRDFLTVGLLLKKLHVLERGKPSQATVPDNWIYVQERDVRVGRIQIFNNWRPYMVADRKNCWIGLEYFVNEGDDLWSKKDEDMVRLGVEEMVKIGFLKSEDVLDGCVLRIPKAYPSYIGTYDQLSHVQKYTDGFQNLFLIGRNGQHRYNNQDHSMLTAMLAVDNILGGRTDKSNVWGVNIDDDYHEGKR